LLCVLGGLEETGGALIDIDEGVEKDDEVEKAGDGSAEGEPDHIESLDAAGEHLQLGWWGGLVRIDGCGFGTGGQQTRDPREEGDVNDHEGADINVGQDIGNGVCDL